MRLLEDRENKQIRNRMSIRISIGKLEIERILETCEISEY